MVEIIKDYAKKRPDVNYLHVWLSDARNNICECENCRQELVSISIFVFSINWIGL